jgi:hypothetical protein
MRSYRRFVHILKNTGNILKQIGEPYYLAQQIRA